MIRRRRQVHSESEEFEDKNVKLRPEAESFSGSWMASLPPGQETGIPGATDLWGQGFSAFGSGFTFLIPLF
jgi:hypothetical protein